MATNKGFTLIELVIVIVLLGVLGAIAIPKFADNTENAERAVVLSLASTFKSSVKIAQLKWLTSNRQRTNLALSGNNFINMVDFSQFGCPVQHWRINSETDPSANNATDCMTVFVLLMDRCQSTATDCGNQPDPDFSHAYLGGGVCEYTYRNNNAYRIRYETNTQQCLVSTIGF